MNFRFPGSVQSSKVASMQFRFCVLAAATITLATAGCNAPSPVEPAALDRRLQAVMESYEGRPEEEEKIGLSFIEGPDVEQDPEAAVIWLRRAVAHGLPRETARLEPARRLIARLPQSRVEPRIVGRQTVAAGTKVQDCPTCPTMIVLPRGIFMMGGNPEEVGHARAEEPRHAVVLLKIVAASEAPITFSQWDACASAGACRNDVNDMGWGRGDRPVINVMWSDVKTYLDWLNSTTGGGYRLLSEAEWEYGARGGTDTAYWWGDQMESGRANCSNCGAVAPMGTTPVKTYSPNPYGLYDMAGNVWQWVADCPGNEYAPTGPDYRSAPTSATVWWLRKGTSCTLRGLRGGAWDYEATYARAGQRSWYYSVLPQSDANIGFRVALVLGTLE